MTKVIDSILSINAFEQQYDVLKVMLQSLRLKDHMETIGIYQSVRNRASFEHKYLNNIKSVYQHAGKCDDQQKFKYILEAAMVSTPEEITDYSPSFPMTQTTSKKPSARRLLRLLTNIFDVKNRNDIRRFRAAKPKHRATESRCGLWKNKTKRKWNSKINENVKHKLYKWITRHPHVAQSPISNHCLKLIFDDQTEPQMAPKLLLQVFVREIHNSLVSDPNDDGIKEAIDEENNIIISDYTLRTLLPSQLKQISAQYKVVCGCEC